MILRMCMHMRMGMGIEGSKRDILPFLLCSSVFYTISLLYAMSALEEIMPKRVCMQCIMHIYTEYIVWVNVESCGIALYI